ncbi:sodium-dependent lysophosphatidylcholine symporter 1 [Tympanuchus pallidicinctus]|uniref:sodium-dependent lysophosphatidylcholine symporter 1 n=2 Tax=Tetraoninae TaxID=466585 RepID=UPI001C662EE9|nr:sodium-dependent lysophosphatidylcholine symporter 1 [Lagopus leucura]XP_048824693.1 sodium-dependent lysophosphatidylcholine symporter 1 [Lagopus muta]XP_052554784.1 sodium-dependent lysophosphatidylcholine symporter 1 [Tympanuchus pallidicinctus]
MAGGGGAERVRVGAAAAGLLPPSCRQPRRRESRERLSVCSKLCYAVGGAPYQTTGCALGFFLQIYLLDVAQLDPFYASIILFVGRAWDAVTDPMVGFFISKTPWTRFGRLMPWIIFSTPFAVISYFLIWFVPDISRGQVMWYLIFYCIFQTLVTCFHVPYSALTMFISREQSERDSATAYRMTVEVLGTVLGTAIQGQIVGKAVAPCIENPPFLSENNFSAAIRNVNMTHYSGSLADTRNAYMVAAGVIGGLYILCAVILSVGVREKRESSELQSDEPVSFFRGLKLVMNHGAYIKLITGFLFTSLAFMLLEGNFALFCTYTLGFRNEFQNILLAIMLSATLTIPFWQWFLTRFGKKTAVYVGISSAVPFLIMVVVLDSNLVITYIVAVAAGISVAAAFLLPWSMLPDVIDDFKLQHPESRGHEAIFFSFYVFFTKFTSGVSLGISTLSLDFAGYQTRGCSQPSEVNVTLKLLVSAVPVGLILLGLLLFKLYPIDEEKRRENKKALQDLREESNSSSESDSTELANIV